MISPNKIKRVKDSAGKGVGLEVVWSDSQTASISAKALRDSCPCATCEEPSGFA